MPDAKISPILMSSSHPTYPITESPEPVFIHGPDYWQARRAFLSSYRFSEASRTGRLKEKLRRSMVEMNEAAIGNVCRGLSRRRFVIRVFRFKITLPTSSSSVLVSMRCFIPSYSKVEKY